MPSTTTNPVKKPATNTTGISTGKPAGSAPGASPVVKKAAVSTAGGQISKSAALTPGAPAPKKVPATAPVLTPGTPATKKVPASAPVLTPGAPASKKAPAPAPVSSTPATNLARPGSSGTTSSSSSSRPPTPPPVGFGTGPTLFRKFNPSLLVEPGAQQPQPLAQRPAKPSKVPEGPKK